MSSMMFDSRQIATLPFQTARQELERLRHVPSYAVPVDYVASVASRAIALAQTDIQAAAIVGAVRGRLNSAVPSPSVADFWKQVRSR